MPRFHLNTGFLTFLAASAALIAPLHAEISTLREAYTAALKNSERIAISEASIRQAEGLYRQALGSAFPPLSYRREQTWRDAGNQESGSRTVSTSEGQGMFRLTLTDLTGYRELAAVRAGRSAVDQRVFARNRAEQLLLFDIAAAYYGLIQADENIGTSQRLIDLAGRRTKELQERVRVGRSRDAEAVEQDFQLTTLESQSEEAGRSVGALKDLLGFLTAEPVGAPAAVGVRVTTEPVSLDLYLQKRDTRPDVGAARQALRAAAYFVDIARSGYFPRAGATANYYTDRPAANRQVNWDVSANLSLPLFAWGNVRGGVIAAKAAADIAAQELQAIQRQADMEIRNAHRDLVSAQRQLAIAERAAGLARRDYDLQQRDDRRGLVTNLEVLEALNRLNSAELAMTNARVTTRLADINLKLTAGATPEEVLR